MLIEFRKVRERSAEETRRWFHNEYFDLIIWYDKSYKVNAFKLCYDKLEDEKLLMWNNKGFISHELFNINEDLLKKVEQTKPGNQSFFVTDSVVNRFKNDSKTIDERIANFVYEKIIEYKG